MVDTISTVHKYLPTYGWYRTKKNKYQISMSTLRMDNSSILMQRIIILCQKILLSFNLLHVFRCQVAVVAVAMVVAVVVGVAVGSGRMRRVYGYYCCCWDIQW